MPRKTFTFEGKRYDVTARTPEELAVKIHEKKKGLRGRKDRRHWEHCRKEVERDFL